MLELLVEAAVAPVALLPALLAGYGAVVSMAAATEEAGRVASMRASVLMEEVGWTVVP